MRCIEASARLPTKHWSGYYYKILAGQGPEARGGAYDYVVRGHMIVAAYPPSSVIGKTGGTMAFHERHGVTLLGLWHAGQHGPPSPPAPERTIAETDVLILAGHIDRLRALQRMP